MEGKMAAPDFITASTKILEESGSSAQLMPFTESIYGQFKKTEKFLDYVPMLKAQLNLCSLSEFCFFHYSVTLAAVYEELSKYKEAIDVLLQLASSPYKVEDKLYYDFTRLSSLLGNKTDMQKYMSYLRANYPESEYTKIISLYE
jgi:hypothetical protein